MIIRLVKGLPAFELDLKARRRITEKGFRPRMKRAGGNYSDVLEQQIPSPGGNVFSNEIYGEEIAII